MAKLRIVVLYGGTSRERKVSIKTGKAVARALALKGHEVRLVDPSGGNGFLGEILEFSPDVVFVALHGTPGEDGTFQGLLEVLGIKYVGSDVLASALSMDKWKAREVFRANGIPVPDSVLRSPGDASPPPFDPPWVVKPRKEGSSIGVSIVRKGGYREALEEAWGFGSDAVVERWLPGPEVTVGIIGPRGEHVLPPIKIVPKRREFFDFAAKYTPGETIYEVPAKLPDGVGEKVCEVAHRAFSALGCRHLARVDMMLDERGNPRVLEVNTIPGMTETSLLPMAARAAGISFEDMVDMMVHWAVMSDGKEKKDYH